jgi:hypothetical protein
LSVSKPVINDLPIITSLNVNTYTISGSGVSNGTVILTLKDLNNKTVSTTVKINAKGNFSTKVNLSNLIDGQLIFKAYQIDKKGNVSAKISKSILKDTIGPSIIFQVSNVTFENQSSYQLAGIVEANTTVSLSVSDGAHTALTKPAIADSNGLFTSKFDLSSLNDGDLTIKGVAKDSYGNSTTITTTVNKNTVQVPPPPVDGKVYQLNATERATWGIYNDGTHPIETTNGINNALKWAHDNGYTVFHLPGGTYLIAKGVQDADENAQINMVSDMTFLMDTATVLQKETNKWEQYAVISLKKEVRNVTFKSGTIKGDRYTHDYSYVGPYTDGTHEWGFGISTEGPMNVIIDGVKFQDFTGDGIQASATTVRGDWIGPENVELGGLDDNGKPITQAGKIRTNQQSINLYTFNNPVYQDQHYRNVMMWTPEGVTGYYNLFFYRNDGTLIRIDKDQHFNSTFGYSRIPVGAAYWRAVFNATSTSDVGIQMMTVAVTENLTIQNSDIGNNRRQGISLVGTDGVKILNNKIHDIQGTAPESGIDMEPGFYPALNTEISGNEFKNNMIHLELAYGGHVIANNNYFGPGATFYSDSWGGVSASNNTFDHSAFVGYDNVNFMNNNLINSSARFEGGTNVIVHGIDGMDSDVSFKQTVENGIQASNISLKSSGLDTNQHGIANWGDKPIHLNTVYLQGNNGMGGDGNDSNVYDNVTFENTSESALATGTYNNPVMTNGHFSFNPGKVKIIQGQLKNTTFYVYNLESDVTIQNSVFDFDQAVPGNVILAMEAKNITILNNTINDNVTTNADHALIQIGRDAWQNDPNKVYGATIKGTVLKAHSQRVGIDTINGGVGAPVYDVEDNSLYNCSLLLTPKDINLNNKILTTP